MIYVLIEILKNYIYIYNGRLKLHRRNKGEKSNLNEQAYKLITQK